MSSNFPITVSECCLIKLLPYILFEKYIHIIIGNGQPREPALCQLYRHTFAPYIQAADEISEGFDGAKRELDFGVDGSAQVGGEFDEESG